ncbi:MAG: phosphatidate phosphatase App1 family protein, partial [Thiolinea sp.]
MPFNQEKQVTFYPTYGYQYDGNWHIPLRIWVREPADFPLRMASKLIRRMLRNRAGLDALTPEQKALFKHRTEAFIADQESFEHVRFVFDQDPEQTVFSLSDAAGNNKTDFNGLLSGELVLSESKAAQILAAQPNDPWLTIRAVSKHHTGVGRIRLIPPLGMSVVSDIDDTIKVTGFVEGSDAVLRRTFFEEFIPAPGMAAMYQAMGNDTAFHYVSGGPWQMYPVLAEFLFGPQAGFPLGSMHMKSVRTHLFESESYDDIWRLLAGGSGKMTIMQKNEQISALLSHFPQRKFVLIGDSGEYDPEIFSAVREQHVDQIHEIRIRDVAGDAGT